jgi:cobalt-zinc-cadmium efflux system outer membrane protein
MFPGKIQTFITCSLPVLLLCFIHPNAQAQAQAQQQAIPGRLTLADAENLLLERNLTVTAARYQVEAARAARLIASYKPNPVFTVGAEQFPFYSNVPGSYPRFFATNPDAGAQPTYTLRFDKIIERGGKREFRTEQADFQLKTSEAQMLDAIRTQMFQLRQAFNNAILARQNLILAQTTQQQYEQTEKLTQVRLENGDLPAVELYRVRAGKLQFQQAVLQAQSSYDQATRDILNLLGARTEQVAPLPIAQNASLTTEPQAGSNFPDALRVAPLQVVGSFDTRPIPQSVTELRQIALNERPDVVAARNTFQGAGRGLLLAQSMRRRDFDISYEYQRVGDDHSLGIVFQVPLFVYNNQKAGIDQADAQRKAAEAQLRAAEFQAVTDVEKAYRSYESARRVLELYNSENLSQVEKLRTISTFSFNEGAASLLELLDAQRTYNQSMVAYNQAMADYQLSVWQLEQATGRQLRLSTNTAQR